MKKPSIKQGSSSTLPFVQILDMHLSGLSKRDHWSGEERETARQILTNDRIIQQLAEIIENHCNDDFFVKGLAAWLGEVIFLPQKFEQLVTHQRIQTLQEQTEAALKNIARFRKEIARSKNVISDALAFSGPDHAKPNQHLTVDQLNDPLETLQSTLQRFKALLKRHPTPTHSRKSKVESAKLNFFVREVHCHIREMTGRPNFRLIAELAKICLRLPEAPLIYDLRQICRTRKKPAETS